jgi:predicted dehydrogenase/threonine dehydrogenase-like Zn-dependent dehydrogenase
MKQVAQRARDGRIVVVETPVPSVRDGWILVSNVCSLISAGTERSKLELGSMNLAQKARARPDLTKQVLRRARSEGVRSTMAAVRDRLDSLSPLGYSSAGIVRELGPGVEGLVPGDRVACAGGGWANHAEVVAVPKNLVAKIPAEVSFEEATYGTVGAIALHAVRQSGAVVGERIGVIGLGLVGQLAMRILRAAGCHSTGVDVDEAAVDLAATSGFAAFIRGDARLEAAILDATDGLGLDAILVCAGGRSSDPVELAAQLARDRGRVVIVGDVAVAADRRLLYEKELELRLSRSYGAGRYDREYEEGGRDLPIGYVRWTEQRNLRAFLELIATGRIEASTLTTHRFPVESAADAYAVLWEGAGTRRPFGVLLDYEPQPETVLSPDRSHRPLVRSGKARVGLVGAGSFARRVLIPALRSNGAELVSVATESGLTAADVASRFGFQRASLAEEICLDEDIDVVVIATRHSSHATLAATALRAGKAVFVEKPLALNWEQLREVEEALGPSSLLFVGFNRRFAPLTARLGDTLALSAKKVIVVRVNAGALPQDHWLNDADEGGGRLIGEGCHFVDLITHLAQAPATTVHALAADPTAAPELSQSFVANLRCANGTVGSIIYAGNGDPRLAKERIEGFAGGIAAVLDDFSVLEIYDGGKKKSVKGHRDKGHRAQIAAFLEAAKGNVEPPPAESYLAASRATLALADSLRIGEAIDLG